MTRYWDPKLASWVVPVYPGEIYTTVNDELVTTVLGSCISVCVRVERLAAVGINHFMLPHAPRGGGDDAQSARYGMAALERLLNALFQRGARRSEMELKMFGGGRVLSGGSDVGRANIEFVHRYLAAEGMALTDSDVGGRVARRLRVWARSGRIQVLHMKMSRVDLDAERAAGDRYEDGTMELF